MSVTKRIETLIEELTDLNRLIRNKLANSSIDSGDFENFAKNVFYHEKSLNQMMINEETISILKELKLGFSTNAVDKHVLALEAKCDLHKAAVVDLENLRSRLRKSEQYTDDNKRIINNKLIAENYSIQLYSQAMLDLSTIIDFLD